MYSSLIALEVVGQLNKISIDSKAIIKRFALTNEEPDEKLFLRIVKTEGFKAKFKKLTLTNLSKYPLPAIVRLKIGIYLTILKVDTKTNEILLYDKEKNQPYIQSFEEFEKLATDTVIILTHKNINAQIRFGFRWFYNQILNYKKIVGEILLASFIIQLFALVTPLFTQVILDKVLVHHSLSTLNIIATAFAAIIIFELLLNLVRNYIFIHTTSKIDSKLGSKLFYHLLSLPLVYFENRKVGNIIARVRELDQIREFIANKSITVILDILFSFVFVFIMFLYSIKLTFIALGFVLIIALLYFFITPVLRARLEEKFQMGANSNSYLVESVTGMQTVKSLSIEGSMQKKWEEHLSNYVEAGFKLTNLSNTLSSLSTLLQKLMTLSILYFGVGLVIEQKLSVGQLIAFQMFANQFSNPILRLVGLWNEFQQTLLSVDRLGDILNSPTENTNKKAITLNKMQGEIRFENISFKYTASSPEVLKNFTLNVKAGESVGLVGRSGSGKSTLTKLIQRLYITSQGAIYIDDIDIRHMNPSWLRQNIGVVLQENYLFSGTIRENIEFAFPGTPIANIIAAAKIAGADEFISEMPEGYDTLVGERGSSLSGGQKQRIAIARALLCNPKILIFDEATSALDYESEKIIQNNMNAIKSNRTMFIVAHRLSTVKECTKIVVMDRGKIVEIGTHDELINKKGYYYALYIKQG
ncbi:type I secretion system permease/ATPase [Malaciobacter mytili]|uniref:peptidase domain-containing ABC transporter n=1 Tax=Malaciobacter mytili TaxID=603050 RepID=UPI00100BA21D|nr:type I secretion system permease/ATPase [Malaciobacter mytili]RXI36662.1 type I secretion system permease/ATPase [Malaciobacter mytili]